MEGCKFIANAVPQLRSGSSYSRTEDEFRIFKAITEICNQPGPSVLVLSGESGIGRAALISGLFKEALYEECQLLQTTFVFWLNCFQWRDHFDDDDKEAFNRQLMELARFYDPAFDAFSSTAIIPHFIRRHDCHVLFVFDNVFHVSLLKQFVDSQLENSDYVSCLAILTQQSLPRAFADFGAFMAFEKLDPLSNRDIQTFMEDFYEMKGKLSPDQLSFLAGSCFGLPLIASLIRPFFKENAINEWTDTYEKLVRVLKRSKYQPLETVQNILKFNFSCLPTTELKRCFYAVLFFVPSDPISVNDLRVFWGPNISSSEVVEKLLASSLILSVQSTTEQKVVVHELLYEAVLEMASRQFHLKGSREERLHATRVKLVSGELYPTKDTIKEIVMFEAVRQQRLSLCKRVVEVINARSLLNLCRQHSQGKDDDGKSLLHFLYCSTWPDFDVSYPWNHIQYAFGVNTSYQLLDKILTKLKKSVCLDDILSVVHMSAKNNGHQNNWKTFLVSLFDDENDKLQSHDRHPLILLLNRWKAVSEQETWRAGVLSDLKNPLLAAVAKNDEGSFLATYSRMKSAIARESGQLSKVCQAYEANITKAIMGIARCGVLKMMEFVCLQEERLEAQVNDEGWTAMMSAAKYGHMEMVKLLAEKASLLIAQADCSNCWTPIMLASENGHLEVVRFLGEKDHEGMSLRDKEGWTPMIWASANGQLAVVKFLAEKVPRLVSTQDNSGMTPLMHASLNGHVDVVKFLAEKDSKSVIETDIDGGTAMILASKNGCLDVVKLLAKLGPQTVSQANNDGWTPMLWACTNGHFTIVKFLAENDPKTVLQTMAGGWTPMMMAAKNGHLEIVKLLAWVDANTLSQSKNDGVTALLLASSHGHLGIVQYLSEKNAQLLSQPRNNGWTPIMAAAQNGHLEVVEFLVEKDPSSVLATANNGCTPLIAASENGHVAVAEFLEKFS